VLIALGHAVVFAHPSNTKLSGDKLVTKLAEAAEIIRAVFTEMPSYDMIVPVLIEHGIEALPDHCHLTPGIPLKPMLAHPTKSLTEVLDRFENIQFTCEWKYDGERAQVHRLPDGKVFIYSRNSENLTPKYPEVLERINNAAKEGVESYVLDCECVAWDREKKTIRPFQALSTRKRKDVNIADIEIQVCLFAFDILYLNGEVRGEWIVVSATFVLTSDSCSPHSRSSARLLKGVARSCTTTSRPSKASSLSRSTTTPKPSKKFSAASTNPSLAVARA
jgi:DNA ligase-1